MQNFKDNTQNGDFYEMPNVPSAGLNTPVTQKSAKNNKHRSKRSKDIIIIGLYAALFTIFSVTVQIFEFVCDIEAIVGLLMLLAGIMLGFILTLDAIARGWSKNSPTHPSAQSIVITGIVIATIAIGLYMIKNTRDTWRCPPITQSRTI